MSESIVARFAQRIAGRSVKANPAMEKPDDKDDLFGREPGLGKPKMPMGDDKPGLGKPELGKPTDKLDLDKPGDLGDEMGEDKPVDSIKSHIKKEKLSTDEIDELIDALEEKRMEHTKDDIDTEMSRDEANIKDDLRKPEPKPSVQSGAPKPMARQHC